MPLNLKICFVPVAGLRPKVLSSSESKQKLRRARGGRTLHFCAAVQDVAAGRSWGLFASLLCCPLIRLRGPARPAPSRPGDHRHMAPSTSWWPAPPVSSCAGVCVHVSGRSWVDDRSVESWLGRFWD